LSAVTVRTVSKILDLAAMGISIERRGKWYDPKPWKAIYKGEEIASGEGRRRRHAKRKGGAAPTPRN